MKPKILLIYTGGTIGMMEDPNSGTLKPFNFDHLSSQIPELNKLELDLEAISFERPIDSSEMNPGIWKQLAEMIAQHYSSFDGFVVLHGSDTMAYTASALSFMLQGLQKPVILTGSQLPIGTIRTDGKENLLTSLEIAASRDEKGNPVVREVAIYFEYRLLRGNRTTKVSANHFNAFSSGNYPVLAEAGVSISFNENALLRSESKDLRLCVDMEQNIGLLKIFPGMTADFVQAVCAMKNLKGLVMETFGSGNGPTEAWFLDLLQGLIQKGIPVINITQCASGSVDQGKYSTSKGFAKIGVISGKDMTTEAAVTKLMFLLAQSKTESLAGEMGKSICGEIS